LLFKLRRRLDQLNSLFVSPSDPRVEALGVPAKTREGVKIPFLPRETTGVKVGIPVLLSFLYRRVKHANLISVENLDLTSSKPRQIFFVIEAPIPILEEPVTLTNARALFFVFFSLFAGTAIIAVFHCF